MHPLIDAIIEQLQRELATAIAASEQAHSSATHSENVADNKYDTLALEAAYLAHGQSVRISELQATIDLYKRFKRPTFDHCSSIKTGALVGLEDAQGKTKHLLLGPAAGGLSIILKDRRSVQIVTKETPLGQAMLNKYVDDELELLVQNKKTHYVVTSIE